MTFPPVARAVLVSDVRVRALATCGAMLVKFGLSTPERTWGSVELTYPQFGVLLAVLWSWMLSVFESRDERILGRGLEEFRRVGQATAFTFGSVAVVSVVLKVDFSRMYVGVALPLGLLGLVVSRAAWRLVLERRRKRHGKVTPVLVAGSEESASRVAAVFDRDPACGMRVVGAWDPQAHRTGTEPLVALRKGFDDVGADTLLVTDPHAMGHEGMRRLRWEFEGVDVLVSPHFFDVAPGRVTLTHVAGETLIQLGEPQFKRAGGLLKVLFDRAVAAALIVVLAPLMLAAAAAVKLTSPGPVLFGHKRVGRNGQPFIMWKFRSMREGADQELGVLLGEQGAGAEPLFKVQEDPRITPVGRFLRRFSIDELPQLFNVVGGNMSLVGPRPQVPEEVALYEGLDSARLKVRPGITGLWQVSGRSNLTWQEAVRLDVYYVENWSMLVDLLILVRTVGAVLKAEGAR